MKTITYFVVLILLCSQALAGEWISHTVSFSDTRTTENRKTFLEVIELPSLENHQPEAVVLMIPGFFQNAASFDLLPEKNISIARHLMRKLPVKIYLLNVRGLGKAQNGRRLFMDDFVIDDIPAAIKWLALKEKRKVIVFGHSQGGIMLQASVGGLTRCGQKLNCFKESVAIERQKHIRAVALSAANVAMTTESSSSGLVKMGELGVKLGPLLSTLDRVDVEGLVKLEAFSSLAYLKPWGFLYHRENVSKEAMLALFQRTLDTSWSGVIVQFSKGIVERGIRTKDGGEDYVKGLGLIKIPLTQVTYGVDPMAEPIPTFQDSFSYIGSETKKFYELEGLGHEDYMMNSALHHVWEEPLRWLLTQSAHQK